MSSESKIEWTDASWNPIAGCKAVSPGCDNCYAAREASGRLKHLPVYAGLAEGGVFTGEVRCLPERLDAPLRWKSPRRIFVNSMSDLFHPYVPSVVIGKIFDVMTTCPQHTFQVLTKRPSRMRMWTTLEYGIPAAAPRNVWLGTSIESEEYAWRADHLRETPAAVRFLSLEPLLGSLPSLDLSGIDWVIVGGESGPRARPMHPRWVRDIRDQCIEAGVPFFFKQWGEWKAALIDDSPLFHRFSDGQLVTRVGRKIAGRELDGRTWDEYPS